MWKRKYLSKGVRLTLIKSTLSRLSIYFMSLFIILRKVILKLKKIQKDFFWGKERLRKKMHLLNWLTVYMDNKNGSLSIRRLNEEFSVGDLLRKNFPLEASDCKEVWGRREGMSLTGHEEDMWWDCIRQLEAGMGFLIVEQVL